MTQTLERRRTGYLPPVDRTPTWKPAPGCHGYFVSDQCGFAHQLADGRIRHLTVKPGVQGYVYVFPYVAGKKRSLKIHRLVAEAFLGPAPDGCPEVNHIDGDKLNNTPGNLEWTSHQQNARHAQDKGLYVQRRGERHSMAKLTNDQVREIKRQLATGRPQKSIATEYGRCISTISHIATGRQWSHVS